MRNGYETKDGKRIVAYAYVASVELEGDGWLTVYHAGAPGANFRLSPEEVELFLTGFRAFLSDAPELALPVVRTAADVLALMPTARQGASSVRIVEGFVQASTHIPGYSKAW